MLLSSPFFAAALPTHPGIGETIVFQINGLLVVFLALATIWGVLELTGIYFRRAAARAKATPPPAVVAPAPLPGLPPQVVAAISGAVCVVIDARHRILAIAPVTADLDWAHEGRRQIFASHQVR